MAIFLKKRMTLSPTLMCLLTQTKRTQIRQAVVLLFFVKRTEIGKAEWPCNNVLMNIYYFEALNICSLLATITLLLNMSGFSQNGAVWQGS